MGTGKPMYTAAGALDIARTNITALRDLAHAIGRCAQQLARSRRRSRRIRHSGKPKRIVIVLSADPGKIAAVRTGADPARTNRGRTERTVIPENRYRR